MKMTILQIDKKTIFLKVFKNLLNNFNVVLAQVFVINKDIIQVYKDKNNKLLSQNIINITLKTCLNIRQA